MSIPTKFQQDIAAGNLKQAMQAAGASSGDLWRVPVDKFVVLPGLNVRPKDDQYEEDVEVIVASILKEGFYQDKPIAIFVDDQQRIIVRDGHTRLDAVLRAIKAGAQIETLPAVNSPRGTTMEDITVGLWKHNTGRQLPPIGKAALVKRMLGWGRTEAEIAARFDVTEGYINNLIRLLESPDSVQKLVSNGKVSAAAAIAQIKKEGPAKAAETLTKAAKEAGGKKVTPKALKAAAKADKPTKAGSYDVLFYLLRDIYEHPTFAELDRKLQTRVVKAIGEE